MCEGDQANQQLVDYIRVQEQIIEEQDQVSLKFMEQLKLIQGNLDQLQREQEGDSTNQSLAD